MFLFKASGKTYRRVARGAVHAFPHPPSDANADEVVFLSKNREDCRLGERQIRFAARIRDIRPARPSELESLFPGVSAEERWKSVIRLYCVREIQNPFDLAQIKRFNAKHYSTVQGFARVRPDDARPLLEFLAQTNPQLILDMLNAEGPEDDLDL
jgi:hypothetical protein